MDNNTEAVELTNNTENSEQNKQPVADKYEIIGVRFKKNGKVYYFAPGELKFGTEDNAIVETARGLEYGAVVIPNKFVPSNEVVLPLKTVIRKATDDDYEHLLDNERREKEAFDICVEKIAKHGLEMKLTEVEYTFDNSKLLFYFTADGRVDFRELVKDLASVFRTRIELRQIGIRDQTKMLGGLGTCGRPYCCNSFMNDFVQVSIKMAKEQGLSLNSSKISGACGRLMCCLRYEYDTYAAELAKMPRIDAIVVTPDGEGVVTEVSPLSGIVKVALNGTNGAPKAYSVEAITRIKGYIKSEGKEKEEITDELRALERD